MRTITEKEKIELIEEILKYNFNISFLIEYPRLYSIMEKFEEEYEEKEDTLNLKNDMINYILDYIPDSVFYTEEEIREEENKKWEEEYEEQQWKFEEDEIYNEINEENLQKWEKERQEEEEKEFNKLHSKLKNIDENINNLFYFQKYLTRKNNFFTPSFHKNNLKLIFTFVKNNFTKNEIMNIMINEINEIDTPEELKLNKMIQEHYNIKPEDLFLKQYKNITI